MSERIPQSVSKRVVFRAYLASDGKTLATGKTIAITISKNGGAFANPAAGATNATEISSGFYYFDLGTSDTGTKGPLAWRGAEGTIDDAGDVYTVVNATNADFTALPNAAADAAGGLPISDAGGLDLDLRLDAAITSRAPASTALSTSQWTNARAGYLDNINNAALATTASQSGDAYARLGAPAGASVSADIAAAKVVVDAVKVKTDYLPSATAGSSGGVMIAGSNAATTLASLTVTGLVDINDGIDIATTTTDRPGVKVRSNGTGAGIDVLADVGVRVEGGEESIAVLITGNSTEGTGLAIRGYGNTVALSVVGDGNCIGAYIDGALGLDISGQANPAVRFTSGFGVGMQISGAGNGLNITGDGGHGVQITGFSGNGVVTTGSFSYNGIQAVGGIAGHGAQLIGGDGGSGLSCLGSDGGSGALFMGNGSGVGIAATGGATGRGLSVAGGSSSGDAVVFTAQGGNSRGMLIQGQGSNDGLEITGGATGIGVDINGGSSSGVGITVDSTSGDALQITAGGGNSDGIQVTGQGSGNALNLIPGATGNGLKAVGGATSGDAISLSVTDGHIGVAQGFQKGVAVPNFTFRMFTSTGDPALGLVINAARRLDGGNFDPCANAAIEVGGGAYSINLSASDMDGDIVTLLFNDDATGSTVQATMLTIKTEL